jgi:xylulokinase
MAFGSDGSLVAEGKAMRPPRSSQPGEMVHHAEDDWWSGTREAIGQLVGRMGHRSIDGIGIAGLFPAVVLLDHDGRPLTDGILYGDVRATDEAQFVADRLGIELTGDEVTPRLLWTRDREPERFARAERALGPAGYVGFRLTGEGSIDPHSATRWGGISNRTGRDWNRDAVERLELPVSVLPAIKHPDQVIGGITARAARETGLPEGVPVVAGTTDSLAALVGNGVTRPGEAMIYYGSTGTLLVVESDLTTAISGGPTTGFASPYVLAAYSLNSGTLLEHVRRNVFGREDYERLDLEAAASPPGAGGLFVIPAGVGRFPSSSDSARRTTMFGLGAEGGRGAIWRALLESFGYVIRRAGGSATNWIGPTTAAGGGARSRMWLQVVSDITNQPQIVRSEGGSARGAAFLAAYGTGELGADGGVRAALDAWTKPLTDVVIRPDPDAHAVYDALMTQWTELCELSPRVPAGRARADLTIDPAGRLIEDGHSYVGLRRDQDPPAPVVSATMSANDGQAHGES